jgi:ABC-type uncharacterized transport system YnjBCD ATPase subunit
MTFRDELLDEFYELVDKHPLRDAFWEVVFSSAEQMNVPSALIFSDEPQVLLAEWREVKQDRDELMPSRPAQKG